MNTSQFKPDQPLAREGSIMKLQEGPAFGALIIGGGVGYLLIRAGKPVWMGLAVGLAVGIADYAVLVFLKSKGIGK